MKPNPGDSAVPVATRLRVILVHGIRSDSRAWASLVDTIAQDHDLAAVEIRAFNYPSPTIRFRVTRVIPSQAIVAARLRTYVQNLPDDLPLALIAHSQGGLIVQRCLVDLLENDELTLLRRFRSIILLACPNNGSSLVLALRKMSGLIINPQERSLRPINDEISRVHSIVVNRLTHSGSDQSHLAIPIHAYAGETDGVVKAASAFGAFRNIGVIHGDHASILDFSDENSLNYDVLKRHLLRALVAADEHIAPPADTWLHFEPRQAPLPQATLYGRTTELATLKRFLSAEPSELAVLLLTGPGGIGKTELVARALYDTREARRGGELYLDLRGVDAKDADDRITSAFLNGLGLPVSDRPRTVEARRSLLIDMIERQHPIVVLDNVEPGHPFDRYISNVGHFRTILITAAPNLYPPAGIRSTLGPLSPDAACAMLLARLHSDFSTPDTLDEIAEIAQTVGYWPLALVLVGAAFSQPSFTGLDSLLNDLRAQDAELDPFVYSDGSSGISTALSYTFSQISTTARTLAAGIADLPGPEVTLAILEACFETTLKAAWRELIDSMILVPATKHSAPTAYRILDPVRLHLKWRHRPSGALSDKRVHSLARALLSARSRYEPDRPFFGRSQADGHVVLGESDIAVAIQSLPGLIRRYLGRSEIELAILLANTLPTYEIIRGTGLELHGPFRQLADTPVHDELKPGIGYILQALANIHRTLALGDGGEWIDQAITFFFDVGDREGFGYAMNDLGLIQVYRRDFAGAEKTLTRSEQLLTETGHPIMALQARRNRAISYLERGDAQLAARELKNCRNSMLAAGDHRWAAFTLPNEAKAHMILGDTSTALQLFEQAISETNTLGDERWTSITQLGYADALRISDRIEDAIEEYESAARVLLRLRDPLWHARSQLGLGLAISQSRRPDRWQTSVNLCHEATTTFEILNSHGDSVRGHAILSRVFRALGDSVAADAEVALAKGLAEDYDMDTDTTFLRFFEDLDPDER